MVLDEFLSNSEKAFQQGWIRYFTSQLKGIHLVAFHTTNVWGGWQACLPNVRTLKAIAHSGLLWGTPLTVASTLLSEKYANTYSLSCPDHGAWQVL